MPATTCLELLSWQDVSDILLMHMISASQVHAEF